MANFPTKYGDCWFSRLEQRFGSDYFQNGRLLDRDVIRNADRIINDIIFGHIDYDKYGYCIMLPTVFPHLLAYIQNRYGIASAEVFSLTHTLSAITHGEIRVQTLINAGYDNSNTIDPGMKVNIETALKEATKDCNKFLVMYQAFDAVRTTNNVYELQKVPAILKQYIRN